MKTGPLVALGALAAGLVMLLRGSAKADELPAPVAPVGGTPPTPAPGRQAPAPSARPPVAVQPPPPAIVPVLAPPIVVQTPDGPKTIPVILPPVAVPIPAKPGASGSPANPNVLPLRLGSKGPLVKEVKNRLNSAVGAGLNAKDENYDAATVSAVKRFQTGRKDPKGAALAVDGVVGPLTYVTLLSSTPSVTVLSGDVDECVGAEEAAAAGACLRALRDRDPQCADYVERYQRVLGLEPEKLKAGYGVYDVPTASSMIPLGFVPEMPRHYNSTRELKRWIRAMLQAAERDPQRADEWSAAIPRKAPPHTITTTGTEA